MVNGVSRVQAGHRRGGEDLAAQRLDRQVDADHLADLARPGARRADDRVGRGSCPRLVTHGGDPAAVDRRSR